MKAGAVIVAAGSAARFGGRLRKPWVLVRGQPVAVRAARRFRGLVDAIVLVVHPGDRARATRRLGRALRAAGVTEIVTGGARRQDSVRAGMAALPERCDPVLVHDAARPFPPRSLIRTVAARAARVGAAVPAVPVTDTLKRVGARGLVGGTVPRKGLFAAQTPQGFRRRLLERALDRAARRGLTGTDEGALVEALGGRVALVPGSPRNLKITVPGDLAAAEGIAAAEDRS